MTDSQPYANAVRDSPNISQEAPFGTIRKDEVMTFRTYDASNMNRFRLVDAQLEGLTTDSWGIELVLRALAGSRAPILPTADGKEIDHAQYLAYWHGLHFLTVARLGWRDPGRGLRAWHDQGRPPGDTTLDFIASVWGQDQTLDAYIAWATINHANFAYGKGHPSKPPSEAWMRWARQVHDRPGLELLEGGSNLPHLGSADDESDAIHDDEPGALTIVDSARRRAIYLSGRHGFYEDLRTRWKELPDVAPSNWRVEVFNRRLGYLGEYRLSRTTGRLHIGKHSVHMLGN